MKKLFITALFTFGTIFGQENNFKKYLSDNNSIIDLENDDQWNLLKSDAILNQFIILGESHGAKNPQLLDFNLLKYLNKTVGTRKYIAELDFAQATAVNEYLEKGNVTKLKNVFRHLVKINAQWGNEDFYNKIVNIRTLNLTLPKDKRIIFIGIDGVQDLKSYLTYIASFIEKNKNPLFNSLQIVLNKKYEDLNFEEVTLFAQEYLNKIQANKIEFQTELKNKFIIFEYLFHTLGLKINMEGQKDEEIIATKNNLVLNLIDKLKVLIIIDGFDELNYKKHREIVIKEIQELANYMENSKLIVTSRTSDFNYSIENIHVYELCSLDENQIELFAEKWLGDKSKANDFIVAVRHSPFSDTTIRPLTIAHLCAIYERIGKIPEKPKTVYKKVINLLLEEWDEQRNVKRISKYASFEIDRKFEFLSIIAYYLSVKSKKSSFTKETLINAYLQIYENFDLEKQECSNVVQEIETHTGLFIQSGFDLYEFAHKSLQEYLTAEYIVKLPFLPDERHILQSLPNELAIAVSISSNPSNYLTELVQNRFLKNKFSLTFFQTFVTRLLLEKPDFNKNEKVGIAALLLYSLYLNPFEAIDSRQLTLFVIDDMVTEFEMLIDEIFKRNTKKFLEVLYEKNSVSESINGTKILTLKKIKGGFKHNKSFEMSIKDYDNLPEFLNCRESFLIY